MQGKTKTREKDKEEEKRSKKESKKDKDKDSEIEKDKDKLMDRTKLRPLPTKKITTQNAFWISVILTLIGLFMLFMINYKTAFFAAAISASPRSCCLCCSTRFRISLILQFTSETSSGFTSPMLTA